MFFANTGIRHHHSGKTREQNQVANFLSTLNDECKTDPNDESFLNDNLFIISVKSPCLTYMDN